MIVSKIYGGLAGQMFQYALGRYLSLLNETTLYLDTSWYNKEKSSTFVRDFGLDRLNTNFNVINNTTFRLSLKFANKFNITNFFGFQHVKEKDYSTFDPAILRSGNNTILDGYWNSYKYFEAVRDTLISEFRPREVPDEKNRACLQKIKEVNSVSIHFRRGDYALTSFHGMLSKEYYTQAINSIKKEVADPYLFIFSDEPEWVISNMSFDLPYAIVDFNKNQKNYWDIELMRNCKHNIIANSGFSWWGAWLNENKKKTVIAPKVWIAEKSRTMNDLIPEGWIRL